MYRLLFSYFNTALCSWMVTFLMPLILLDITNSPTYISAAYAVGMLPYVIVTPIAGVLGDSLNKKKMIQVGELVSCILVIVLTFVSYKKANIGLLLMLHFTLSSTIALHHPVFQAIIPSIIAKKQVSKFNAYVGTIDNLISISAPVLVGLCLLVVTKTTLLYGIAAGYLLSAGIVSGLAYVSHSSSYHPNLKAIIASIQEGFKYVWSTQLIKYAMLLFVGMNLGFHFFYASFMYHLKNDYSLPESQLSYYLIPFGCSSIIGSLLAPRIINRFADGKIIACLCVLKGCIMLIIALSQHPLVTSGLWGIIGGFNAVTVITFFTLRQKVVPHPLLSRTVAFTRMVSYLAIPLGAISGGMVFEKTHDFTWIAMISGGILLLSSILFWRPLTKTPTALPPKS